jgi:group I intron endonuclease
MKYQDSVIYAIKSKTSSDTYIGSTVRPVSVRFKEHIRNASVGRSKLSEAICRDGKDNFTIEVLRAHPCNDIKELHLVEGCFQRALQPTLNKRVESRTRREYYCDNWVRLRAYSDTQYACECGGKYWRQQRQRHFRTKKHVAYLNGKLEKSGGLEAGGV